MSYNVIAVPKFRKEVKKLAKKYPSLKSDLAISGGTFLKQARTKKGFSQSELAKIVGVHVTNISRYERGENKPTSEVLSKLAEALDPTVDYLMSGSLQERAARQIADKELLSQFKRVEQLPKDKKRLVKEFLESFLITSELKARLK